MDTNHKDTIEIRPATKQDIPTLLNLIKQLAEHHNFSDKLVATEATLEESLFGDRLYAEVVFAYFNQMPVAYALFTHNFSTLLGRQGLYLCDLYVDPSVRNKGIGHHLLIHLAKIAKERKCGRLEWSVLKSNTHAINFYENIGATALDDWITYRITEDALNNLAAGKIE